MLLTSACPVCVLLLLVPCSGEVVAFKAVTAGDTTAAGFRKKKTAKGLSSGSYTFWKESATGLGAASSAVSAASVQACLDACDSDAECAAVAMTGITSATAAPASCSVTKAVVTKLDVSAALWVW